LELDVDLRQLSDAIETMARKVGLTDFSVQFSAVEAAPLAMLASEEEALTAQYRPGRLATFRAGRSCAHRAVAALGLRSTAILRDAGGAPVWPVGLTGSIAHTRDIAVALVTRDA
jgi:4'-phosphopantetheinyl transferase EntD